VTWRHEQCVAEHSAQAQPRKLRLQDVTVAVADTLHPALAARALRICVEKCDFADAVLFSDAVVPGPFRCEMVPALKSLDDYTRFCLQEMPKRIGTGFVLIVQWDGYLLDPAAWSPGFLRYDYIGAPYLETGSNTDWIVGNGGFSLRSRRLLAALPSLPIITGLNEDRIISQTFRQMLERDHHIRFAPEKIADRFSFEQRRLHPSTFGFHGVFNLHRVETDDEVMRMVDGLTPLERSDGRLVPLINQSLKDGRADLAARLFERVRDGTTPATLRAIVSRLYSSTEFADRLIAQLEALARPPGGIVGTAG
jgi:Protein of unknown function (DUF5672)